MRESRRWATRGSPWASFGSERDNPERAFGREAASDAETPAALAIGATGRAAFRPSRAEDRPGSVADGVFCGTRRALRGVDASSSPGHLCAGPGRGDLHVHVAVRDHRAPPRMAGRRLFDVAGRGDPYLADRLYHWWRWFDHVSRVLLDRGRARRPLRFLFLVRRARPIHGPVQHRGGAVPRWGPVGHRRTATPLRFPRDDRHVGGFSCPGGAPESRRVSEGVGAHPRAAPGEYSACAGKRAPLFRTAGTSEGVG